MIKVFQWVNLLMKQKVLLSKNEFFPNIQLLKNLKVIEWSAENIG